MMSGLDDDAILHELRALPCVRPSPHATARIRARSRAIMQAERQQGRPSMTFGATALVNVALVVVCGAYFTGALTQAIRLFKAIR
jgi:hypothetical protein